MLSFQKKQYVFYGCRWRWLSRLSRGIIFFFIACFGTLLFAQADQVHKQLPITDQATLNDRSPVTERDVPFAFVIPDMLDMADTTLGEKDFIRLNEELAFRLTNKPLPADGMTPCLVRVPAYIDPQSNRLSLRIRRDILEVVQNCDKKPLAKPTETLLLVAYPKSNPQRRASMPCWPLLVEIPTIPKEIQDYYHLPEPFERFTTDFLTLHGAPIEAKLEQIEMPDDLQNLNSGAMLKLTLTNVSEEPKKLLTYDHASGLLIRLITSDGRDLWKLAKKNSPPKPVILELKPGESMTFTFPIQVGISPVPVPEGMTKSAETLFLVACYNVYFDHTSLPPEHMRQLCEREGVYEGLVVSDTIVLDPSRSIRRSPKAADQK